MEYLKRYSTLTLSVPLLLSLSTGAPAADSSEFYGGAHLGYSFHDDACETEANQCENEGVFYGLLGGYSILDTLGLELAVHDLPDTRSRYPDIELKGDLLASDLSLRYSFMQRGKGRNLYGKIGVSYWHSEVESIGISTSDDGFRPTFSLGYEHPLNEHFSTRLQYQYVDKVGSKPSGYTHLHMLSIGVVFGRGHHAPNPEPMAPASPEPEPRTVEPLEREPEPAAEPAQPEEQRIIISDSAQGPLFDTGSAVIRYYSGIQDVVDLMQSHPNTHVRILGHTDAQGNETYNLELSEQRAIAVMNVLVNNGIDPDRISFRGLGEQEPVASNSTPEGRAKNRRVEFVIRGQALVGQSE